jgi:nucleotide-binding universal stress UspA family protein
VPIWASLTVIALTLALSVWASLRKTAKPKAGDGEKLDADEPGSAKTATVLFATDGSDASTAAERLLGRIADRRRVQVEVLMVNSFDAVLAQAASTQRYDPAAGRDRADGIVRGVVERMLALGLNARGEVVDGEPAAEIVSAGARVHAGLIVLGAGRKGRLDSLLLGSTSTEVLRASDTSMLIVHECRGEGRVDVLVGTDGSEGAGRALETFAACADPKRCDVTVLAVKSEGLVAGATDSAGAGIAEAGGNTAASAAERAAARLGSAGFSVTTEVATGNAANILANRARDYELAVAGSRGLGTVKRALLGSVCDKLLRQAQSVLVGR